MDVPVDVIVSAVRMVFEWVMRLLSTWRHRGSRWDPQLARLYSDLTATLDRTFAAIDEYIHLRKGLHWWNGRFRLRLMRATDLDKRVLRAGEDLCASMERVRAIGSPTAVHHAEELLALVADPMLRLNAGEKVMDTDLAAFDQRRRAFLEVVRSELGIVAMRSM